MSPRAEAEGPRFSLEMQGCLLGQLTLKSNGRTFILHFLSYDHQAQ